MHRGQSVRQTAFALHDHAQQKKSAHAESAREKEIQSIFAATHVAPRDQVIINAAKNAQTPLRIPSRQSPHAATPDRYRHRSNRLQEPRSPEKIRQRKRQNPSPSRDRHAGIHAPQNHARDQAQPFGAADEIRLRTCATCSWRCLSVALISEVGRPPLQLHLTIDYLANHRSSIPKLARYFFDEWRPVYEQRGMTLDDVTVSFEARANVDLLPLTLVAIPSRP